MTLTHTLVWTCTRILSRWPSRHRGGVRPKPKPGGYVAALEEMLEANEKKAGKDRLTVKRIWLDLAGRGCGAGYNVVCRHAARWRRGRGTGTGGAYVPLEFDPGEAYRFDWSQEHVVIAGATTKLKVAHLRLCHSRMSFARAYPRETREMVFDAHDRAFESFGGSCRTGICDNTGTAVDVISAGRERRFNRRFERMCSHHLVSPEACRVRRPAARAAAGQAGRKPSSGGGSRRNEWRPNRRGRLELPVLHTFADRNRRARTRIRRGRGVAVNPIGPLPPSRPQQRRTHTAEPRRPRSCP